MAKTTKRGRPKLEAPRERLELRLDEALLKRARRIARRAGAQTLQAWIGLVVHRAVQDAELYR